MWDLGQAQGLTRPACVRASLAQEALRKIITTLAVKNEEIQSFIYSLKQMLLNVEVRKVPQGGREGSAEVLGSGWAGGREGAAIGASLLLMPLALWAWLPRSGLSFPV